MLVVVRLPLRERRVTPAVGLEPSCPGMSDVADLASGGVSDVLHRARGCCRIRDKPRPTQVETFASRILNQEAMVR